MLERRKKRHGEEAIRTDTLQFKTKYVKMVADWNRYQVILGTYPRAPPPMKFRLEIWVYILFTSFCKYPRVATIHAT